MAILALKLLLAPAFAVATSLISRRFGTRIGGVVGGLPIVAGPILLVLALTHGAAFTHKAAAATLLGVVALVVFANAYVAASRRFRWPAALTVGWLAFCVAAAGLRYIVVGPLGALGLACAACAATLVALRRVTGDGAAVEQSPAWNLLLRAACAAAIVTAVTGASGAVGPRLTGLFTAFPVVTSVLAAFTHAGSGSREVTRLLYGFALGWFAMAVFCFALTVTIKSIGVAAAFILASSAAFAVQAGAVWLAYRRDLPRARPAPEAL